MLGFTIEEIKTYPLDGDNKHGNNYREWAFVREVPGPLAIKKVLKRWRSGDDTNRRDHRGQPCD